MKKILFIAIFIASLLIIKSLLTSIYTFWQKQDLVVKAQQQLDLQKKKHDELVSQLSRVQNSTFVEQEARDKLFMVKPAEQQVIIPKNIQNAGGKNNQSQNQSNWKQWLSLFFD